MGVAQVKFWVLCAAERRLGTSILTTDGGSRKPEALSAIHQSEGRCIGENHAVGDGEGELERRRGIRGEKDGDFSGAVHSLVSGGRLKQVFSDVCSNSKRLLRMHCVECRRTTSCVARA